MSEQSKETAVFWTLWGIGPVCAMLAVAASGWPQMLGEGYLSFMALLNAALAVAAVNSSRLRYKLEQARVARRTPPLIEWASIGISILVGIALGNLVLIVCPVVYGVLKHREVVSILIRNGERLSFGQVLTSLCMGIGVVSGAMLLFAVAVVITDSFTRAITGASLEDMPDFMELLKHLAVILSFAIGSKYAARGLGAGISAWALWAGVLVAVDSTLDWILGMTFEWEDVAILVGTSGIVFGAEWIFRKAERGKV